MRCGNYRINDAHNGSGLGDMDMCVLVSITIKHKFPLSSMQDTLEISPRYRDVNHKR